MLQRIQSVYLALNILISIYLIFANLAYFDLNNELYSISSTGISPQLEQAYNQWMLYILAALLLIIAAVNGLAISQFAKRKQQVKTVRIAMFLSVVFFGVAFFIIENIVKAFGVTFEYGSNIYFPIVLIFFCILAQRNILKDEALVRAADRLR